MQFVRTDRVVAGPFAVTETFAQIECAFMKSSSDRHLIEIADCRLNWRDEQIAIALGLISNLSGRAIISILPILQQAAVRIWCRFSFNSLRNLRVLCVSAVKLVDRTPQETQRTRRL